MLPWPTLFDYFLDHSFESPDAVSTLPVTSESIVPSKRVAAKARIRFRAGVDFGMAFQIVAPDEALVAMVTFELTVTQMSLHMGFDVLLPSEALVTPFELAGPLVITILRALDEHRDVIQGDVGFFN